LGFEPVVTATPIEPTRAPESSPPTKRLGVDPDRIRFDSLDSLLAFSTTIVATGRITSLEPGVPFYGDVVPDALLWVGTPTHLELEEIALDVNGDGELRSTSYLQSGGTFEDTEVWFAQEPLLDVGTRVVLFGGPRSDAAEDPSEYWTLFAIEVDESGRLVDGIWSSIAPFLVGMTADQVLDAVRAAAASLPVSSAP
jgi:hypothetical protein